MVRDAEANGQKTLVHRWRRQHRMGTMPRTDDEHAAMEN